MKKILAVLLSVCLALCPSVLAAEPIDADGSQLYFPSRTAPVAVSISDGGIAALTTEEDDTPLVNDLSEPTFDEGDTADIEDYDENLTIEEMVKVNRDTDSEIWYHIEPDACPGHDFDEPEPWDAEKPEAGWFVACLNCGHTKTIDYCPEDDVLFEDEAEEEGVAEETEEKDADYDAAPLTTVIEETAPETAELDEAETSENAPDTEAVEAESVSDSSEDAEE